MSSIDVIVPCYRYAHYLHDCVMSVLNQGVASEIRVLIIDDASPDDTAVVAENLVRLDSRVTFLRHTVNKGHIATYNAGLAWANAKYLLLLSADDYLLPGSLARSIDVLERHPTVGMVFGNCVVQLVDGRQVEETDENETRIYRGEEFIRHSGARNIVSTPTAVVRTSLQNFVGGYNAALPHSGDMELWLRLATYADVGFVKENQAVYRRHSANMSDAYYANHWVKDVEQRRAAIESYLNACTDAKPSAERFRSLLTRSLARDAVGYASHAFNDGEMTSSQLLAQLAVDISPGVRRSLPWLRFSLKKRLGLRLWKRLSSTALFEKLTALNA